MGRGTGVRERGSSIQIDFKYRGVRCRELLRLEPNKANLKFAANLKARIEHEIATNTFDYATHFPGSSKAQAFDTRSPEATKKVYEHINAYLTTIVSEVEPETLAHYHDYANTISQTHFGNLPLCELQPKHMRDWVKGLTVGRKRIVNLLTPLRGALRQAVADGVIETNPLADFKIGRRVAVKSNSQPREKIDPLTPEELKALGVTACGKLWTFWAWTGLRTGEVIALGWDDVAADGASIRVWRSIRSGREKRTKTPASVRTIPLLGPARRVLADLGRKDGQKIFPHPVTGETFYDDQSVRLLFHADSKTAGVRRRPGPYCLRHTFASIALSSGEPLGWVSATLGHSDAWVTLKTYAKWIPSAMPDAGARMLRHDEGTDDQKPR